MKSLAPKEKAREIEIKLIAYLKAFLDLAKDTLNAEKESVAVDEQNEAKGALTELFTESKSDNTPIIVGRIVKDIDEIVQMVRFPDWQSTTTGERLVRKELRYILYVK